MPLPQPSFADLGVPSDIVAALKARSIITPFPIQSATVIDAMAGRDVCGKAPTGSGKTLAFGIGAVARLTGKPSRPKHPRMLVLTPTRELCAQVASELATLCSSRNLRVETFYGGVGYGPQLKSLSRGVDIAVACPGRLGDLIERGSIRLDAVEIVVIDEADRMADMGFLPDVRRLLDQTPSSRQTLLFSATLDGDIDVLVKRYQKDPVRHELEAEKDASEAVHLFWKLSSGDRVETTASIAAASGPTIVFCRTKHSTDRIARQLEQRGVRAAAIHGDRSQKQRERALESFVRGSVDALIATDVAARGIHVDGVNAVVHFDPPTDAKDYVHRSGRTARAGATGVVISFVTPDKTGAVKRIQRDLGIRTGIDHPDMAKISEVIGEAPPRRTSTASVSSNGSSSGSDRPGRSNGSARTGKPWKPRPGSSRGPGKGPRVHGSESGSGNGNGGGHKKKLGATTSWSKSGKPGSKPSAGRGYAGNGKTGGAKTGGGSRSHGHGGQNGAGKQVAGAGGRRGR
ncbi:MAG TPA: DEAD/DEAH box helicase [Acidimicrobiales bacterium]|nr:DEAD/DEAH box helicase [Acidimicrobiales bacterium]